MENTMDQADESMNLQPMFNKTSNSNEISIRRGDGEGDFDQKNGNVTYGIPK